MKIIKEKGITLVALVVTIIILLILTGVTISQVTGNDGLFKKAKEAVERYKNAQEKEQVILDNLDIGEENKHYIYNKEDLEEFRDNVNKGYSYKGEEVILMDNIDLGGKKEDESTWWQPIGSGNPDNSINFEGTFEGNNHSISGLYNERYEGMDYVSFFPSTNNVEIKNLTLDGEFIIGENNDKTSLCVSGFIGFASGNTKIENCINSIDTKKIGTGNASAGFIAVCEGTVTLNKCINEGNISGSNDCAGLIGIVYKNLTINNCCNTGNITNSYGNYTAGLIGRDGSNDIIININNSYNSGKITGCARVGGIAGRLAYGKSLIFLMNNCFNMGEISEFNSSGTIGGLIGQFNEAANPCDAKIYNSYNIGPISIEEENTAVIGGILGESLARNVEIINCYNQGSINSGTGYGSGLVGNMRNKNATLPVLNINNSYNSGKIIGNNICGIIHLQHLPPNVTVNLINTYYSKASATSGTLGYEPLQEPTGKEDLDMKTQAFVDELNNNINSIKSDVKLKKWIYKEGEYPTLEK